LSRELAQDGVEGCWIQLRSATCRFCHGCEFHLCRHDAPHRFADHYSDALRFAVVTRGFEKLHRASERGFIAACLGTSG
jgi:hypothetical protein